MKKEEISAQVDSWIVEEELPVSACIKPISKYGNLYPKDEDEFEAYMEFRRWYLSKDHTVLLSIPVKYEYKMPVETDNSISFAYGSMDFKRLYPFNKYQYKIKKIHERIKNLATTFSSVSHTTGKQNIKNQFHTLVDKEFRNKALELLETYSKHKKMINQEKLLEKIEDLYKNIYNCKCIWKKYAFMS